MRIRRVDCNSIDVLSRPNFNFNTLIPQNGALGNSCKDAGGHFNPGKKNHGDVNAEERHEGDFGNIVADSQGVAKISVVRYKYIQLSNQAHEF